MKGSDTVHSFVHKPYRIMIVMENQIKISQFLDSEGRITQLPKKQLVRLAVLQYLAEKFEPDCEYSEQQVNAVCAQWHTFNDYFLLRRELVDHKLLNRERDGSRYWRAPEE